MAEPITREEIYLNSIASGETPELKPITREEMFLAKAGGQNIKTPTPITRKEMFLSGISSNGGGGENKLNQLLTKTLTEVTAEDLKGITTIPKQTFEYQASLSSVTLPDEITSIEEKAFNRCKNLKTLYVGSGITYSDSYAFDYTYISNVYYSGNLISWNNIEFNNQYSSPHGRGNGYNFHLKNNLGEYEVITHLVVPSVITQLNKFFAYGFNVESITLHNTLISIGERALCACNKVKKVIIPNSVTTIAKEALGYCNSLEEVRIGNGITSIASYAFVQNTSSNKLTDIYIDKPEGSISGSPWGASSATVHWNTPLPSEEV